MSDADETLPAVEVPRIQKVFEAAGVRVDTVGLDIAPGPWLPYLPLPFPIQLRVLDPIPAPLDADPEAIREHVRIRMQTAMDDLALRARTSA